MLAISSTDREALDEVANDLIAFFAQQEESSASALSSVVAPKWTILHEHRFQLHKALRKQRAVPNQPKVHTANAVMDIFLAQEAETIDLLNRECKNAEVSTDGEWVRWTRWVRWFR